MRASQFDQPRLSPDGAHLAVMAHRQENGRDTTVMAIYDVATLAPVSVLRLSAFEVPLDVHWVSNTRLVVAKGVDGGSLEMPVSNGELLATDYDGKHTDYLYGYQRSRVKRGSAPEDRGFAQFSGTPDTPNGHFYLSEFPWQEREGESLLFDVDAISGNRTPLARVTMPTMHFLVDHAGQARYAIGADENNNEALLQRLPGQAGWEPVGEKGRPPFQPLAFAQDDQALFALAAADGGPRALFRVALSGQSKTMLASDPVSDIDVEWQFHPLLPFAVATTVGVPKFVYLAGAEELAAVHRALSAKSPGDVLYLESSSADGNLLVFIAKSDRNPGVYYLHDRSNGKTRRLFARSPWIDADRMASRVPFDFMGRDGVELHGYLTLPPGKDAKNLPMILMPHGGPHGVADTWFYDPDAQFLASCGYAVLQVNYRGSSGRGQAFMQSGYREWGQRIQDDLIDAVRWAISEEVADPARICTYGGSFGGYSALMAVARAPALFKCAVGYAGVYDLPMMLRKGDVSETGRGVAYLTRALGSDPAVLAANSPTHLAAKIKVPVLLVHGEEDQRAPLAQAQAMRAALVEAGSSPEWMVAAKEGHGFYAEKNREAFYARLEAFLGRHLGSSE